MYNELNEIGNSNKKSVLLKFLQKNMNAYFTLDRHNYTFLLHVGYLFSTSCCIKLVNGKRGIEMNVNYFILIDLIYI